MTVLKKFFNSSAPNWAMAVVSGVMLADYISRIEISPADRGTAYVAFAWALMLGIWLSTAIYRTWFRRQSNRS